MSFSLPKFTGAPPGHAFAGAGNVSRSAGLGPVSDLPGANPTFPMGSNLAGNPSFAMNFNTTQNPNGNFGGFRI